MLRATSVLLLLLTMASSLLGQQVNVLIQHDSLGIDAYFSGSNGAARAPGGEVFVAGEFTDNLFRIDSDGTISEVFSVWPGLRNPRGIVVTSDDTVFISSRESGAVIVRIDPDGEITLWGNFLGLGPNQQVGSPHGLALDSTGQLYAACRISDNLMRFALDGTLTELVGPAGAGPGRELDDARAVAVDAADNIYVAGMLSDNVLHVTPDGVVTEVIGPSGDGGDHRLDNPVALATGPDGSLYVASMFTHSVLKRDPLGTVSVVITSSGDGAGNGLFYPFDVAVADDGTLYVAGLGSDNVFAVSPGGVVTEIADLSGDGLGNLLNDPSNLIVDAPGSVIVACAVSDLVFRIDGSGVTLLADADGFGDGAGNDGDLALDSQGRLLLTNYELDAVVRYETGGSITTLFDDSGGPDAAFKRPRAVATDSLGRPYVACPGSDSVFRIEADGTKTLIVGPAGDGAGNLLEEPYALSFDSLGNLFVAGQLSDNVLRVAPDGTIDEVLGPEGIAPDQPAAYISDLAVGPGDVVYAASTGSKSVFAIYPSGTIEEVFDIWKPHPGAPVGTGGGFTLVAVDPLGRVFTASQQLGELFRSDPDGSWELIWSQAGNEEPGGLAADASGAVYLGLGPPDHNVVRIDPSGALTEVLSSNGDGLGEALVRPRTIGIIGPGRFHVSGYSSNNVFEVDPGACGGWTLIPGALPADGSGPLLTGEGMLCTGSAYLMQLSDAPASATAQLVVGMAELNAPFKGGTLIPFPHLVLPLPTDVEGGASFGGPWPDGLPSGASVWLQAWIPSGASDSGFVASNGVRIDML